MVRYSEDAVKISPLRFLAITRQDRLEKEKDIRKIDVTDLYEEEKEYRIKNDELINIQIIGQVTSGKSAVMCNEVWDINTKLGNKMDLHYIAADQIEFNRKTQTNNYNKRCVGIDEWNPLSEGGLNSSLEQQYHDWQSQVAAQLYIHRIACAPMHIHDKQSDMVLEVLAKDKEEMMTRCLLHWRLFTSQGPITQLLGYVDFDLENTLHQPWYERYRKRKFAKLDLIRDNAVRDPRDLESAEMTLAIFEEERKMASRTKISRAMIKNTYNQIRRKQKLFQTEFSTYSKIEDVEGLLDIETSRGREYKKWEKQKAQARKATEENEKKFWTEEARLTYEHYKDQSQKLQETIDDLKRLVKVFKEYEAI